MTRLSEMFARARAEKRLALMPFMTAGYPDLDTSFELMRAMVEAGADAIEVGIPFSDPLAEGPTTLATTLPSEGRPPAFRKSRWS